MNENEAKHYSLQLMETSWAVYFTTIDVNGFPQTRAMDNLRNKERFPKLAGLFKNHDDDFWSLFDTNTSSAKMDQIKKNPAVSVYYCEPREFRGLMLGGFMEIVTDLELKKAIWQDYWTMYYPKGVDDPDYTVLSLYPRVAKYYHQLKKFTFTFNKKEQKKVA
jgi:general stress protein 26